jgi:hypothetical protein
MKKLLIVPGLFALSLLAGGAAEAQTTTAPKADSMSAASGQHSISGEVTKVDANKGWIDVKTDAGSMKLHFPPTALQNVKKGDQVTVDIAMTKTGSARSDTTDRSSAADKTPARTNKAPDDKSTAAGGSTDKTKTR